MRDQEIIGLWEAYQQVHSQPQEEVEQLDEITRSMGRRATQYRRDQEQSAHMERVRQHQEKMKNDPEYARKHRESSQVHSRREDQKESFDLFDVILEHLVAEGYAETNEAALAIMANMSEEWKESIVEETRRTEYLQKKFDKENKRKSGSAHTSIPGKQNTGQALYKARQSERHMRGEN